MSGGEVFVVGKREQRHLEESRAERKGSKEVMARAICKRSRESGNGGRG